MKTASKVTGKPGAIRAGTDASQRSNSASACVMGPAIALPRPKESRKAR